jgi:sirohydrochlorin ferrochelatase
MIALLLRLRPLTVIALAACAVSPDATAPAPSSPEREGYGVLVMAHGGSPAWNDDVRAAVAPLQNEFPVEIAFGMADASTIQQGVAALEARGVDHIGVVRLFVSGESWLDRTRQILGLTPGAPAASPPEPHAEHAGHAEHAEHPAADHAAAGHSMEFWRIETQAAFALSTTGLAEVPDMGAVLAARARALSRQPEHEDVLILAHGPGDDAENARWLACIESRAQVVRDSLPFRRVQVETLREDWPEKRQEAEARIREYVGRAAREGGAALVIPFRVQGFGPYAEVLAGLDYVSDGVGLVPHPAVTRWMEEQAANLRAGPFEATLVSSQGTR